MAKLKYLFVFLLVTGAAYAGSTVFLSYLDAELGKDLPCHPLQNPHREQNRPALPSADDSKSLAKRDLSLVRNEDTSGKTSGLLTGLARVR